MAKWEEQTEEAKDSGMGGFIGGLVVAILPLAHFTILLLYRGRSKC
jgi:hypothetical protein